MQRPQCAFYGRFLTESKRIRHLVADLPMQECVFMPTTAQVNATFVYDVEPRYSVDLEVTILLRDLPHGTPSTVGRIDSRMVNFSRRGFCVTTSRDLVPGSRLALELRGWPAIDAHVAWSRNGRAGCQLDAPLEDSRFDAMLLSVEAIDRAGNWNL
jgi:hypothetical protein